MSEQDKPKGRGGRGRKIVGEDVCADYSFPMPAALRARVQASADAAGRSFGEEVEFQIYEIFRVAELRAIAAKRLPQH